MDNEIKNKIIKIETIKKIAQFFEDYVNKYDKLFKQEQEKNKDIKYFDQIYEYRGNKPKIEYTIKLKEGKTLTEKDYDWFQKMLDFPQKISKISIAFFISFSSNIQDKNVNVYKNIHSTVHFYEDSVKIHVDTTNYQEEADKVYYSIKDILENNELRYNNTIKNRHFRIQSFCFSIGIFLSYLLYVILLFNKNNLNEFFIALMNNKSSLLISQWLVAGIIGNIIGYPFMMSLYNVIIPKKKYVGYNRSTKKNIYEDNVNDYTEHSEVQIGKYYRAWQDRLRIEKIYTYTKKIILIQLLISIILFFILK